MAALTAARANVDLANKNGTTPLFFAAQNGDHEVVTALIAAGATVELAAKDGTTPMDVASRKGHHDIVAALAGADDAGAGAVFAILIVVILVMGVRRVMRRR